MTRSRREVQPHLVPLGEALRAAREAVTPRLSGSGLAKVLGWGQAKVSLIEAGRQTPTVDDVTAWAAATGADRDALLDARDVALTRRFDIRAAARRPGGANVLQTDLSHLEATSRMIAEYQPTLIPGLAQTPAYTRAWLNQPGRVELGDPPDVEDLIARRAARQRDAAGKQVVVVVPAWVLTATYGTVQTQRAQLDALTTNVQTGALELIVVRRPLALLHGFELLDDAVIIETVTEATVLSHPDALASFRAALAEARRHGATGAAALRELDQARAAL